ncbi:hypothetical protein ACPROK_09965 [Glutamicibacter soli]|uniref:COG4315 family predicted lipoprotein n=1 Tax=Glutamicibacter soli TaxID=453836 RepID=UPI003C73A78B
MGKAFSKAAVLTAALTLVLAGCSGPNGSAQDNPGQGNSGTSNYGVPNTGSSPVPNLKQNGAILEMRQTELGSIATDQRGMSIYQFDEDTQNSGASSCTGGCLDLWPPVPSGPASLSDAKGITGKLGTITGADGKPQLTLNGWPMYYYVSDSKPGDTKGQAVSDVWWVVDSAGVPIH